MLVTLVCVVALFVSFLPTGEVRAGGDFGRPHGDAFQLILGNVSVLPDVAELLVPL